MGNNFFIYVNFSEEKDKQDYTYWYLLMENHLRTAEFVEFHIWNEEEEVINQLSMKTELHKDSLEPMKMVRFAGASSENLISYILKESLSSDGEIKWFSIFLRNNGKLFFESSHWGAEINIENPDENEVNMIKKVLPKNAIFHDFRNK